MPPVRGANAGRPYITYRRVSKKARRLRAASTWGNFALYLTRFSTVPCEVLATTTEILSGKHNERSEVMVGPGFAMGV
jgi:hypothetical protein